MPVGDFLPQDDDAGSNLSMGGFRSLQSKKLIPKPADDDEDMFTDFNVSDDDDPSPKPSVGSLAKAIPVHETPTISRKSVNTSKTAICPSSPEPDMDEALLASVLDDCEEGEQPGTLQAGEADQGTNPSSLVDLDSASMQQDMGVVDDVSHLCSAQPVRRHSQGTQAAAGPEVVAGHKFSQPLQTHADQGTAGLGDKQPAPHAGGLTGKGTCMSGGSDGVNTNQAHQDPAAGFTAAPPAPSRELPLQKEQAVQHQHTSVPAPGKRVPFVEDADDFTDLSSLHQNPPAATSSRSDVQVSMTSLVQERRSVGKPAMSGSVQAMSSLSEDEPMDSTPCVPATQLQATHVSSLPFVRPVAQTTHLKRPILNTSAVSNPPPTFSQSAPLAKKPAERPAAPAEKLSPALGVTTATNLQSKGPANPIQTTQHLISNHTKQVQGPALNQGSQNTAAERLDEVQHPPPATSAAVATQPMPATMPSSKAALVGSGRFVSPPLGSLRSTGPLTTGGALQQGAFQQRVSQQQREPLQATSSLSSKQAAVNCQDSDQPSSQPNSVRGALPPSANKLPSDSAPQRIQATGSANTAKPSLLAPRPALQAPLLRPRSTEPIPVLSTPRPSLLRVPGPSLKAGSPALPVSNAAPSTVATQGALTPPALLIQNAISKHSVPSLLSPALLSQSSQACASKSFSNTVSPHSTNLVTAAGLMGPPGGNSQSAPSSRGMNNITNPTGTGLSTAPGLMGPPSTTSTLSKHGPDLNTRRPSYSLINPTGTAGSAPQLLTYTQPLSQLSMPVNRTQAAQPGHLLLLPSRTTTARAITPDSDVLARSGRIPFAAPPRTEMAAQQAPRQTQARPSETLPVTPQVNTSRALSAPRGAVLMSGSQDRMARGGNNNISGDSRGSRMDADANRATGASQGNANDEDRSLAVSQSASAAVTTAEPAGRSLSHDVMAYTKKLDMMTLEAAELRNKVMELRVAAVMSRNHLIRLDNPDFRDKLEQLTQRAQAALAKTVDSIPPSDAGLTTQAAAV